MVPYSCSTCNHVKVIHLYTDVLVLASANNVILASIRIWYWHNRYLNTKIKFSTGAADAEQNRGQSQWSVIPISTIPLIYMLFMFALFNMSELYKNRDRIDFPIASRIDVADRKIDEG